MLNAVVVLILNLYLNCGFLPWRFGKTDRNSPSSAPPLLTFLLTITYVIRFLRHLMVGSNLTVLSQL